MKRVLFDDVFFNVNNTGIARMWRSIFSEFSLVDLRSKYGIELLVLNRSNQLSSLGFETIDFPKYDYQTPAIDRMSIDDVVKDLKVDVFMSSYYTFSTQCNNLGVVYDMIPEHEGFDKSHRGWIEKKLYIENMDSFIGISDSTCADLVRFYPSVSGREFTTVHPGVDMKIFYPRSDEETTKFKEIHGLNDFLVFVGSRGGYKNAELFLESLKFLDSENLDVLFIGGADLANDELSLANRNGFKLSRLVLDDDDLAICLSAADVLVYPSTYEGFGLPPLEALAVGTAVVTTNSSSLPESVGDLAKFCDGRSIRDLAYAITQAQSESWQEKVLSEGPKWASNKTWAATARGVALALQEMPIKRNSLTLQIHEMTRAYSKKASVLQWKN
ncbi:MAG: glycosyltransferase family 1 protein [Planctomycetota bacterium]